MTANRQHTQSVFLADTGSYARLEDMGVRCLLQFVVAEYAAAYHRVASAGEMSHTCETQRLGAAGAAVAPADT
jgi:hypothetical protein